MKSTLPMPSQGRIILAGLVGNVMEWYDFAVYGFFASVIGHQFFPSDNPTVSLIAAFGAFAAGFLVRPLGGLLFGRIGDLVGRSRALTLSVLTMAVPTVFIGLLPTHQTIGLAAPVLLVALRIIQGLSVGGEYTSSLVFLVENAPQHQRAFNAIWGVWGATAGILLGSGVGALLTNVLTASQVASWGWRLPFLVGALVAGTGYLVRRSIHADKPTGESKSPILDSFGKHRPSVIRVALLNVGFGVTFYAAFVYAVTYIKVVDNLPGHVAFNLNTLSMSLLLFLLPAGAWLADRYGRRPLLIAGGTLITLGSIPLFHLIHTTDPMIIFMGEAGFAVAIGLIAGGVVTASVELIPAAIRCTGLAFAYNTSIGWFGGTTPLIAAWLITITGNPIMPAYWITLAGAITLMTAIFLVPETRRQRWDSVN
jgi:MHS family proline/betaine transporter-like MFS transporter